MYETVVSFIGVNHCKPQENHFLALYIQYVLVYKIIFITLFPETLTLASWCFWDAMMKMKAKVKATQSCPVICNPMDFTVHRIFQVRILEWVTFPFSWGSSELRDQTQASHMAGRFFTSWAARETVAKIITNKLQECVTPGALKAPLQLNSTAITNTSIWNGWATMAWMIEFDNTFKLLLQ